MADNDKKVTFELKDLTYEEILNSYLEVCEFLTFLDESKVGVKGAIEAAGENPEEKETKSEEPKKEGEGS